MRGANVVDGTRTNAPGAASGAICWRLTPAIDNWVSVDADDGLRTAASSCSKDPELPPVGPLAANTTSVSPERISVIATASSVIVGNTSLMFRMTPSREMVSSTKPALTTKENLT
eukprot:c11787_g1_i2.p2 GENE.c11787_g1_i2~~c11787_g1_i2.p2  ORF type:complete len:115 (-),score=22.89 c11787_g1_i2:335-679(-)